MRFTTLFSMLSFAIALMAVGAYFSPILADPFASTSAEPILPDPLPYTGPDFPASAATAGIANPGQALESLKLGKQNCSPLNPCAMPSPALETLLPNLPHPAIARSKMAHARAAARQGL